MKAVSKQFYCLLQFSIDFFRKSGNKKHNFLIISSTILIVSSLISVTPLAMASEIDSAPRPSVNSESPLWSGLEYSKFDLALLESLGELAAVNQLQDLGAIPIEGPRSILGTASDTNRIAPSPMTSGPPPPTVGASSNAPASADNTPDPRKNRWKSVRNLEIAYQVLNLVDLAETISCIDRHRCVEANPMIGRNPSNGRLVGYKLATGAVHYVITRYLFNKHPDVLDEWMVGSLVLQGGVVMWNLQHCF